MTKSQLITRLHERFGNRFSEHQVKDMVSTLFDEMGERVVQGQRVELRGFGSFSLRHLGSKAGRNPRTNAVIPLAERNTIYFRPSKKMRLNVQDVIPQPSQQSRGD